MSAELKKAQDLPSIKGGYRFDAALGTKGWFKTGGAAEVMALIEDKDDLITFLSAYPQSAPLNILGVASNTIIRDGGVSGVTLKLGRSFNFIELEEDCKIRCGALALDLMVANFAAKHGVGGLSFLSGIPGTIGGALKMNAGAYGREVVDCLIELKGVDRAGGLHSLSVDDMNYSYRHSAPCLDLIYTEALFQGAASDVETVKAEIAEIKQRREDSQPIKEKTGGSTFANPKPEELAACNLPVNTKCWQLIDQVGGRGLEIGGAHMSEKHCNFMINSGDASAYDLECLGEDIRRRVYERFGLVLRWEIRRIGDYADGQGRLDNWLNS